jgi:hypothetical protein
MIKTDFNPNGVPKEVFDGIREGVVNDRAAFAHGCQHRQLRAAIGHLRRIDQRTSELLSGGQVAELHLAVHGDHIMRHGLRRTHLRPVELFVQRIGYRQRGEFGFSNSRSYVLRRVH